MPFKVSQLSRPPMAAPRFVIDWLFPLAVLAGMIAWTMLPGPNTPSATLDSIESILSAAFASRAGTISLGLVAAWWVARFVVGATISDLLFAGALAIELVGLWLLGSPGRQLNGGLVIVAGFGLGVFADRLRGLEARRSYNTQLEAEHSADVLVHVALPSRLLKVLQTRSFVVVVGALTGVSITASPAFLFVLGQEGASFADWRVITSFAVTFFIPLVYFKLGGLVMQAARTRERNLPTSGGPARST